MTTPPGSWGPPGQGGPYGPPPGSGWGPPPVPPGQQSDDAVWAVLTHLSYFVVPFIGPLVVFLVKKDSSPYVRHHAAESLNFHITLAIASVVAGILVLVLVGFLLLLGLLVWGVVLAIVAAVAAGRGEPYRYPLSIRLVR